MKAWVGVGRSESSHSHPQGSPPLGTTIVSLSTTDETLLFKGQPFGFDLSTYKRTTKDARLVKIDCAGEKFITTEQSLSHYPNTLLGDPARRAAYTNSETGEVYFDRNQDIFPSILYFYQSPGTFRAPEHMDAAVLEEELEFFGIDLAAMTEQYEAMVRRTQPPVTPTLREQIYKTVTDPSTNKAAMVWGGVDLLCIIITISMLVLETLPNLREHFENPFQDGPSYKIAIYMIDVLVNMFFTVDLLIRFVTYSEENKCFLARPLSILDFLAVLPFYVELIVFFTTSGAPPPQFLALKVCRLVRVVRVFKVVRHSRQLTEVMEVITSAKEEFAVLIGVVCVLVLLVGTVIYFVEFTGLPEDTEDMSDGYYSIVDGCWWSVVTITTVGYGDLYPTTPVGRLFGSLVVLFGIVVLAFPMTIIISKFQDSLAMKKLAENKEMRRRLREVAKLSYTQEHRNGNTPNPNRPLQEERASETG